MNAPALGGAIAYRHLLVPVDGTDGATAVVIAAVDLALMVGARVTFMALHNAADGANASPARRVHVARERLSKAEAVARAQGVPCASADARGAVPADALPDAARDAGCDLVFVHADAGDGAAPAALARAGIPALTLPAPAPVRSPAIRIVLDDHRALAAVLHAWLDLLDGADGAPAASRMRPFVRYVETFHALHHDPLEETLLFGRLRERTSTLDAELDELERQHERAAQRADALAAALDRYAAGGGLAPLARQVTEYAQGVWEQVGREEGVILPAARRYLTGADWADVDAAFSAAAAARPCDAWADMTRAMPRRDN
ncbi:hemerythrin domain-containing protein [Burkholderia guangdongensis]|uniref:hemerythrin domain-containing protein n=1 Tax=Burkholderia guangdongensis TaxID=1792500 RepID=UPI0015C8C2E5|nr:hemerythrin domain-containing protein [Burkholderia guangdongensis]